VPVRVVEVEAPAAAQVIDLTRPLVMRAGMMMWVSSMLMTPASG
jgi:hypothetical protein